MSLAADAPQWLREMAGAYESGAFNQFVLHGNVSDRYPLDGALVGLGRYLEAQVLATFDLVFQYDAGNGLTLLRGSERFHQWPAAKGLTALPHEPRAALLLVGRYVRYQANLVALERAQPCHIACLIRGADQLLAAERRSDLEVAALASLVRDWADETPFVAQPFVSLLVADSLTDLHPQVANNPRTLKLRVPLPSASELQATLERLQQQLPAAFSSDIQASEAAAALTGVSLSAIHSLVRRRAHSGPPLTRSDWRDIKKQLVESEAGSLLEFIESRRTLDDYHGQPALKAWLRQDLALWQRGDLQALPKGYLFCGPVGTGKTYLVECLAGEAGVPVLKLKNFRDRWVGSSEANLETIFRLIRALGRCMVFIDEADQTLGQRNAGNSDGGLSGRLYSMIAQEMGDAANRGRVVWVLASSRPDLIEVDLKRPGRVDVKVPLLPTVSAAESAGLLAALLKRYGVVVDGAALAALALPLLLTPGAAEALAVKIYRQIATAGSEPLAAIAQAIDGYQPPVPAATLQLQMQLAVREATDIDFVPVELRHLASAPEVAG